MYFAWALGTTAIPQSRHGDYCVCAITETDEIVYEALTVAPGAMIEPGRRLVVPPIGTWTATAERDLPGLLRHLHRWRRPIWDLQPVLDQNQKLVGWQSPGVFRDAVLQWGVRAAPLRPACSLAVYRRMKCPTSIVRVDFDLRRTEKETAHGTEIHYTPADGFDGAWLVKYDGASEAPATIRSGELLAVFVSPHRRSEDAYLKIGTVFGRLPA